MIKKTKKKFLFLLSTFFVGFLSFLSSSAPRSGYSKQDSLLIEHAYADLTIYDSNWVPGNCGDGCNGGGSCCGGCTSDDGSSDGQY